MTTCALRDCGAGQDDPRGAFRLDVVGRFEKKVLGSDYGADGYATRSQVDDLGSRLRLSGEDMLLDLGSGAGWPGLHLAAVTGCHLVCADVPASGSRTSATRAASDGLAERAWSIRADGRRLPFASSSFTRLVHTDVLCCLSAKLGVLHECRRELASTGRMGFHVIRPTPGLPEPDYRSALEEGPPHVSVRRKDYPQLLESAGFSLTDEVDLTAEYWDVLRAKQDLERQATPDLTSTWGKELVDEWNEQRAKNVAAVEADLLLRTLYVAVPACPDVDL
jgi:cyclopropane fatty-acyl-phospholipid synthase-like methyltransferase